MQKQWRITVINKVYVANDLTNFEVIATDVLCIHNAEPWKDDDRKHGGHSQGHHFGHPERCHQQHSIRASSSLQRATQQRVPVPQLYLSIYVSHILAIRFKSKYIVFIYRERELTFTFAVCHRPSVCLSFVCNVRAPYLGGWSFRQRFYAIWYAGHLMTSR